MRDLALSAVSRVPTGLGGVTCQQVLDTWRAAAETKVVLQAVEQYIDLHRQQSHEPSQALLDASVTLKGNLEVLEELGAVYRERAKNVIPPLLG